MEWLTEALDCLGTNRRQMLWSLPSLRLASGKEARARQQRSRMTGQETLAIEVPPLLLPLGMEDFNIQERFGQEWAALGFSPEGHPMHFHREELSAAGVLPCAAYFALETEGRPIGGLQLVRPDACGNLPCQNVWPGLARRSER